MNPCSSTRRTRRALARRLARSDRGQELVELALILPIMLLILLGVIEFGHAFGISHALTGLSREGANLAARGASLPQVTQIVLTNGSDINMPAVGGAIASRVMVTGGTPMVTAQFSQGATGATQMGTIGNPAAALQGLTGLADGRVLYTVELFYNYTPLTPLSGVLGRALPGTLYEAAVF